MKRIQFLAAVFASTTIIGCASSDTTTDATAMDETTTISETQTMGGETDDMDEAEAVTVETEIAVPVATVTLATLSLTNTEELNDMFESIDDTEQYDMLALAKTSPNLSTFAQLAEAAGMSEGLKQEGAFTLFAPTNEAFSKLSKEDLEMLLLPENKAKLAAVLQAHVLPNEVASTQFNSSQRITLSENRYLPITTSGNSVAIAGATVVVPNVKASNGIIHVVDRVIIPSEDATDK